VRKSKIKEAVNKALKVYYDKGLTSTAAKFRKELLKNLYNSLKNK